MISSLDSFIYSIMITMPRNHNLTTIAVTKAQYKSLQDIGHKNETFSQIIERLLKNANLEPLK